MKVAIFAVIVCALVAVNAAPSKRFLDLIPGGIQCQFQVFCFIDPCMRGCAPAGATCRRGCGCSATWTDASGTPITC